MRESHDRRTDGGNHRAQHSVGGYRRAAETPRRRRKLLSKRLSSRARSAKLRSMISPFAAPTWRDRLPQGVRPYLEPAPLAALFLGISSGFPFAMLAATLTNRLSEAGVDKKSISAFALAQIGRAHV